MRNPKLIILKALFGSILFLFLSIACYAQQATPDQGKRYDGPDPLQVSESVWQKQLHLMFHRDEYRPILQSPEEKLWYTDEGDGLLMQFGATTVAQVVDKSLTDRNALVNFTYDITGAWRVYGTPESSGGLLSWWIQGGWPIGAPSDADLSNAIGSVSDINGTLNSDPIFFNEFYWLQHFGKPFHIYIGRFDPTITYDFNNIANDEREQFLSEALFNSPSIPFPSPGVDFNAWWDVNDRTYLQAGILQVNAERTQTNINKLRIDELMYLLETGFQPRFNGLGGGNYRFLFFFIETEGKNGAGLSLSFDQAVNDQLSLFLRYGLSNPDIAKVEHFFSTGFSLENIFEQDTDTLGVGYAWEDLTEENLGNQQLIELYYRHQINNFLRVSPDIQIVVNPGYNPTDDVVFVFGIRLQATF